MAGLRQDFYNKFLSNLCFVPHTDLIKILFQYIFIPITIHFFQKKICITVYSRWIFNNVSHCLCRNCLAGHFFMLFFFWRLNCFSLPRGAALSLLVLPEISISLQVLLFTMSHLPPMSLFCIITHFRQWSLKLLQISRCFQICWWVEPNLGQNLMLLSLVGQKEKIKIYKKIQIKSK